MRGRRLFVYSADQREHTESAETALRDRLLVLGFPTLEGSSSFFPRAPGRARGPGLPGAPFPNTGPDRLLHETDEPSHPELRPGCSATELAGSWRRSELAGWFSNRNRGPQRIVHISLHGPMF